MPQNSTHKFRSLLKIGILFCILLLGLPLFLNIIIQIFFGIHINEVTADTPLAEANAIYKTNLALMMVTCSLGIFLGCCLIRYSFLGPKERLQDFLQLKNGKPYDLFFMVFSPLVFVPISILTVIIVQHILRIKDEPTQRAILKQLLPFAGNYKWWALFYIGVLAPIQEEFMLRGFLMRALQKHGWSDASVILLQGMVFGLIHLDQNYRIFVSTSLFGIVLGWICLKRKSIFPSIMLHMGQNLIGYLVFFRAMTP
ncbi:MAG: CPBP family intramembrane glutamic endopeptidase [Cytophagales bacterium]